MMEKKWPKRVFLRPPVGSPVPAGGGGRLSKLYTLGDIYSHRSTSVLMLPRVLIADEVRGKSTD